VGEAVTRRPRLDLPASLLLAGPGEGRSEKLFRMMDIIIYGMENTSLSSAVDADGWTGYLGSPALFHDADKHCRNRPSGDHRYG
jgi:hypothetical protein